MVDLTYDKERFNHLYKQMKENDIRFVVASGNQYYQLTRVYGMTPTEYKDTKNKTKK